ncbi:hypothetical protein [Sphingomonas sp.]|jgi:hypothetical protein|uniref:hypothetical protein n=1 Tax=Sphingomonas sp. TaxID=28214 RepID=UPI002E0E1538|nr:hypothetical protein [Sphingomonas sp.]
MARPKKYASRRACASKRVYSTEIAARMGAQAALSTQSRALPILFVYPCPACMKWHVTRDGSTGLGVTRTNLFAELNGDA